MVTQRYTADCKLLRKLFGGAGGASPYSQAEQIFIELLNTEDLDSKIWCADTQLPVQITERACEVQHAMTLKGHMDVSIKGQLALQG